VPVVRSFDRLKPALQRDGLASRHGFEYKKRVKKFDCIHALKALGEESRMRILRMLMAKERSVNEIAESLGMTQYNVSKHLRVLREASLLDQQKQGQQRVYSLATDFRAHLAENKNVLDLGCCTFDFTKLPK
jgi:DNA-binding transcriptional ArsR family regulator